MKKLDINIDELKKNVMDYCDRHPDLALATDDESNEIAISPDEWGKNVREYIARHPDVSVVRDPEALARLVAEYCYPGVPCDEVAKWVLRGIVGELRKSWIRRFWSQRDLSRSDHHKAGNHGE